MTYKYAVYLTYITFINSIDQREFWSLFIRT